MKLSNGEWQSFDAALVAVGRIPNGGAIGADQAGVEVDERGFIHVDEHMRTNVGHIYAIGDVVGGPMLAHKASHEGKVAAEVIAGVPGAAFDPRAIPVGRLHRPGGRVDGTDRDGREGRRHRVREGRHPVVGIGTRARAGASGRDDEDAVRARQLGGCSAPGSSASTRAS